MGSTAIIVSIDKELARLQIQREKLIKQGKKTQKDKRTAKKKTAPAAARKKAKRQISPAARARIAEAQRKRWAAVRKARKAS